MRHVCFSCVILLSLLATSARAQEVKIVLPAGHTNEVTWASFSPDGKRIVTTSKDNTAKLWDVQSGMLLQTFEGHGNWVTTAHFLENGKKIVTTSYDNAIKIWDVLSGKEIVSIAGHRDRISTSVLSKDGNYLATVSFDSAAKVWNLQTGKLVCDAKAYTGYNSWVSFSPDEKNMITAAWMDSVVNVWEIMTGKKLLVLSIGKNYTKASVFFSPDKKQIIVVSYRGIHVFDAKTGSPITKNELFTNGCGALSPDGSTIAFGSNDHKLILYDVRTQKIMAELPGHTKPITAIRFSNDGKKIISTSEDSTAIVWSATERNILHRLQGHANSITSIALSPVNAQIVTTARDNSAIVWDINTGEKKNSFSGHTSKIISAQFSPDENRFLTAQRDHTIKIWNTHTGALLFTLKGHNDYISEASFSPDGRLILSASWDKTTRIWNSYSGQAEHVNSTYKDWVTKARFSNDGKRFIAYARDKTIRIGNTETGSIVNKYPGFPLTLTAINFSPDTENFVVAYLLDTPRIYQTKTGRLTGKLLGKDLSVDNMYFTADSKKIVTTGFDGVVRLWDAATGKPLLNLPAQPRWACFAKESPDGLTYASGYALHWIKLWDPRTGREIKTLPVPAATYPCDYGFQSGKALGRGQTEVHLIPENPAHAVTFYAIDSSDYLLINKDGYYTCTPASAKLLHYITGDLRIITFDQLDVKYNRPDKILESLGNTDTALINSYKRAYQKRIKKLAIDTTQFAGNYGIPESDIVNKAEIQYDQAKEKLLLKIKCSDRMFNLNRFNIWINDVPLFGLRGINIRHRKSKEFDSSITVLLSEGINKVEASVTNSNGTESYKMPLYVKYTPLVPVEKKVYFIGIGINHFSDARHNLQWCVKDIRDLVNKFREKYGAQLVVDTLFDNNVVLKNILPLKAKLARTTINDKVIIAYSGHGLLSKQYDYYLSSYDINFSQPEENGIPYEEIELLLDSIPARMKLLLLDACHSGEVDKEDLVFAETGKTAGINNGLIVHRGSREDELITKTVGLQNSFELMQSLFVNVGRSTGAVVIAAAGGVQFAQESGDLQNGVFSYSILKLLEEKQTITVAEFQKLVAEQVLRLTNGLQKPTTRTELKMTNWNVW